MAFYLTIPLVAGYFASSYGRSFRVWFCLGTFFPVVAHFVLLGLIWYDERRTSPPRLSRREEAIAERLVRELMEEVDGIKIRPTANKPGNNNPHS